MPANTAMDAEFPDDIHRRWQFNAAILAVEKSIQWSERPEKLARRLVVEAQVFGRRAAEQYEAAVKYTGADLPSASIDGVAVSFTVGEFETAVGQFLERLCYATGAHGKPLMVGTGPVGRARTYRTTEKGSIVCPWGDETTSARRRADKANHGINLAPVVSRSQPNPVLLGLGTLSYSPPPVHA